MRHDGSNLGRIAGQGFPAKIDAGCKYQTLVSELASVGEGNRLRRRIDGGGRGKFQSDAGCRHAIVAEILQLEIAQTRNRRIAHWARRKNAIGLDQAHREARIGLLERTSASCTSESAPNDDNVRIALLRDCGYRKNGGRSRHRSSKDVASGYAIFFHMRIYESW